MRVLSEYKSKSIYIYTWYVFAYTDRKRGVHNSPEQNSTVDLLKAGWAF